jgi:hypothetical protein
LANNQLSTISINLTSVKADEKQMTRFTTTAAVAIIVLTAIAALPLSQAQDYTMSYQLLGKDSNDTAYTLNIFVPQAIHDYYRGKTHRLFTLTDFPKFVTPYALKPIADILTEIYGDDEDFVNAALTIVHQMNYVETGPGKYPVETIVDDEGDCDIFSFVAASIIKARGLDTVLLNYEDEKHMNIGVHLSNPPENTRENAYSITYENVTYYIAECTGGNWTRGWRVGECPDNLKQSKAQVITLENAEQVAPGQVSASFKTLEESGVSVEISPILTIENSTVTIKGCLSPTKPNENVTLYLGTNGSPWTILGTAITNPDGGYEFKWQATEAGVYAICASWAGDEAYASSTSPAINAWIIPLFLSVLIIVSILAIAICIIAIFASKHTSHEGLEPKEPQPPTFQ